jgi:hypothetical protein
MKLHIVMLLLAALFMVPILIAAIAGNAKSIRGLDVCNITGSHEGANVTRVAEAAFTAPHLLGRKGTGNRQILVGTATDRPLGSVADEVAIGGSIGIQLLGGADTRILVASGAITVDAPVYTAASGKVSASWVAGCWFVGYALTATTTDGDEIEVLTVVPVQLQVPVSVSATGGTISALQALQNIHVSNAGASGASTWALPAALPGMRVTAIVEAAQELRLDPNGTETVALPSTGVQSAAGKYIGADALAEKVQLVCLTAGTWDVVDFSGTWTAEA